MLNSFDRLLLFLLLNFEFVARGEISMLIRKIINVIERMRLRDKLFVIVSNNCWGNELYSDLGREYNTPFVGLFIFPECYVQLLENFDLIIGSRLEFVGQSKYMKIHPGYPVGLLCGSIEIHFLHYKSECEAFEKWSRRARRLQKSREVGEPLFVKFCDRDGCREEHIARFHATPFSNKISIGVRRHNSVNHVAQPALAEKPGDFVMNGLKLYRKRYHYFDVSDWISTGRVRQTWISKVLSLVA